MPRRTAFLCIFTVLSVVVTAIQITRWLAMKSAIDLLDDIKIRSHEIQHASLRLRTSSRIHACRENTHADTEYAIVSILTLPLANYIQSAAKLGKSARQWRHAHEIDLIMMVLPGVLSDDIPSEIELVNAGWKICTVAVIECACDEKIPNRFIISKMYSKFNAWMLTEYKALALIDSDTLFLGDPMRLFQVDYEDMVGKGLSIAASLDRPIHSTCSWDNVPAGSFNAGVLLLVPSQETYSMLVASIKTVKHNTGMAEQALLNEIYGKTLHRLPFEFNGNLVSVACEPSDWAATKPSMILIHYTVAKGWTDMWECWKWGVLDLCTLWHMI